MKTAELANHLITYITSKGLRDEANKYIEDIAAGKMPSALDTLSQLTAGNPTSRKAFR